jgi:hypothetical protein
MAYIPEVLRIALSLGTGVAVNEFPKLTMPKSVILKPIMRIMTAVLPTTSETSHNCS